MAKDTKGGNKSAAEAAAQQQSPKNKEEKEATLIKGIVEAADTKGLSGDSKVTLAALLQKRYIDNPNASETVVSGMNVIADALIGDVIVTNIVEGKELFALIVRKDEGHYGAVAAMLAQQGITLPAFKSLSAPTDEQLQAAGIKLLPGETKNDNVVVPVSKKDVSQKAIEQKKKEKKAAAVVQLDPTKIETSEQLKEQLTRCFVTNEAPVLRIKKAIDFYNSYLTIQATKAENKEEELKKVKDMTRIQLLNEIVEIVGDCPFAMTGLAYYLMSVMNDTKSPISAFCMLRRALASAGEKYEDDFIADMAKILIVWCCNCKISECQNMIAVNKKNIDKMTKEDAKANKSNINIAKSAIKDYEGTIVGYEGIISAVTNVNFTMADSFEENYLNKDKDTLNYKNSHRIASNIIETYYDKKVTEFTPESVAAVAKAHAGIILNLFRDPLSQSITYKGITIPELVVKPAEEAPAEAPAEALAEEESKN